jgi:Na+/H+ antiporter NhaA
MAEAGAAAVTGRTVWARNLALPVREFLSTEVGSSIILLGATIAALLWANVDWSSYQSLWATDLSIRVGSHGITQDLHGWVNNGLMTFFFFVIGLEARREFDVGDLRERRRAMLPLLAGLGGLAVPVLIYLAFNAGGSAASGWGAAMSTDTAFALGVLALVGRSCPDRLRVFMLTVVVVDDLVALLVIGTAYSHNVRYGFLAVAALLFLVVLVLRSLEVHRGIVYAAVGAAVWVAVYKSGVEPVIVGLVMGLLTYAYPATRLDLERATNLFRSFREQPTPELARTARQSLETSISPNERLQHLWHPWTSYVIVPLFALANAGIPISGTLLRHAFASSITLGILVGYVVGKPVGIAGATWILSRLRPGMRLPVGWAPLVGSGVVAGIGFTVSLLIASLAFKGEQLQEAKVGVLTAALAASLLGWLAFRVVALLPERWVTGTSERLVDLAVPVDPKRDHIRGSDDGPVTLVEYGDYECPFCGRAEPVVREITDEFGNDLRYVFRELPLADVHPRAELAAEAAEAAAAQGKFWEMHDLLFDHQDALRPNDLMGYAEELGLDVDRFADELRRRVYASRVAEDIDTADQSGVTGTPTFFINGRRHHGAYDIDTLSQAVRAAQQRARLSSAPSGG